MRQTARRGATPRRRAHAEPTSPVFVDATEQRETLERGLRILARMIARELLRQGAARGRARPPL